MTSTNGRRAHCLDRPGSAWLARIGRVGSGWTRLAEMTKFNEELVKNGIMLAGEGLHPSSRGARVKFSGKDRTVVDGPFAESKELVAGFWIWQVKSIDDAVEWLKRAPFDGGTEVEIRPLFEADDFGKELLAGLRQGIARSKVKVVATQPFEVTDVDVRSQISRLKASSGMAVR